MPRNAEASGENATEVEERPEGTPPQTADDAPDVDLLQSVLRDKEQLVAALTDRLEQAAEQLDRLRRTGADKGRRPVVGGMPAELVEEHKKTIDDLKRVLTNWEDMQAAATLGRIETQIVELRDLVANGLHSGAMGAGASPRERGGGAGPSGAGKPGSPATGNASWWEKQKAAMLGDAPPPEPLPEKSAAPEPAESTEIARGEFDPASAEIPDIPRAVDLENITLDEAKEAIRERDAIIQKLREPLLLLKTAGQLPQGLQSLDAVPEALKAKIAELETQWQAKFRQAELELSLERARLGREQTALRQAQEVAKREQKQGNRSKKETESDGKGDDASKRRWFKFMGKTGEGGEGSDKEG